MSERYWSKRLSYFITGRNPGLNQPISYWDIIKFTTSIVLQLAAIYFLVSSGLAVWSWYEKNREISYQYHQRAESEQNQTTHQIVERCAIAGAPADIVAMCLSDQIRLYRKRNAANEDLQAQQEMARWTAIMGVVGLIGVPLSIAGLIALWLSLRQTRQAISTDREVGHAQVRAYLAIRIAPPDIFNGQTEYSFKIENTGQSPASQVRYIAGIVMLDHPLARKQQDFVHVNPNDRITNTIISAGDHIDAAAKIDPPLSPSETEVAKRNGARRPYLIVRVFYTDVFKQPGVVHETKFCAYTDVSEAITPAGERGWKAEWEIADILNDAT